MEINILQLHKKDVEVFDKIEDKVSINTINGSLAVSDGATQGFCSGVWADIVTREFTEMPVFNVDAFCNSTLRKSEARYSQQINMLPVNENKVLARLLEEKKKEGGYSTFIGLQFFKYQHVKILCVGDSNLFYIGDRSIKSFPSASLEELNNSSNFINSRYVIEDKVDRSIVKASQIDVSDGGEMFIVTDAIARYLFKNPHQFATINSLNSFEKLLAFAEERWDAGTLEQDDLTIVKIRLNADATMIVRNIIPPEGFRFGSATPSPPETYLSRMRRGLPEAENEKSVSGLRTELSDIKQLAGDEIVALKNELKNLSRQYALQANRTKSLMIVCAILFFSIFGFIYMYVGEKNEFQAARDRYKSALYKKNLEMLNFMRFGQHATGSISRTPETGVANKQKGGTTAMHPADKMRITTSHSRDVGGRVGGDIQTNTRRVHPANRRGQTGIQKTDQKSRGKLAGVVKSGNQQNGTTKAANSDATSTVSTITANQTVHSADNRRQQQTTTLSPSPNGALGQKKEESKKEDPQKTRADTTKKLLKSDE